MRTKLLPLITGGILLLATSASAQDRMTGAVRGIVEDQATGAPVAGATIEVSSPVLQGKQEETTDSSGAYFISNLPPGTYQMTIYFSSAETRRSNVLVQLGKVAVVNVAIDTSPNQGEVIEIQGRAPVIDQGSTKTGRTITEDYTRNIPSGGTFGAVLGVAAGAQEDLFGTSFGGSTSAENVYIIEGINTTDPAYGLQSTNLPNEFIQETELITGGYTAEHGRSTGGVVNVLTKSGSNELHGSVFTYFTPGVLVADEQSTPEAGSAIDGKEELSYDLAIGAEVGGPIIADKLWFHVGINPNVRALKTHRIIRTMVDVDNDGQPDTDENGFPILREVDSSTYDNGSRTIFFTGKLSGAISPEHQGSLSFFGNPSTRELFAPPDEPNGGPTVTGSESATRLHEVLGAWDASAKWTSKLNDNKTQIDAVVGWHRNVDRDYPGVDGSDGIGFRNTLSERLTSYATYEERPIPDECVDNENGNDSDPYPNIINCPVVNYRTGGLSLRELETTDRLAALASVTQRLNAIGQHIVKAGIDAEYQIYDRLSIFTGGQRFTRRALPDDTWQIDRWYGYLDPDSDFVREYGGVAAMCPSPSGGTIPCVYWPRGVPATTTTSNLAGYIQDSWQILPNLTVNGGLRWEQQRLLPADQVAGELSTITMEPFDELAFSISDMFSPRLGVIYDPTREGRSKIFAHWGRFYESIPMDINFRSFGGQVFNLNFVPIDDNDPDKCSSAPEPSTAAACDVDNVDPGNRFYLGGGETLVAPGIQGQYLDEIVLGGEYELLNDFKVGASYVHRGLGSAIEDLSTDGGATFFIANPGKADEGEIARLRREGRDAEAALFAAAAEFDAPERSYDALQLTAEKRFSHNLMVLGSYTLSRLYGNYPGLFSPETGQLDPNVTSMYDLPELMANRAGALSADRTHLFKVDGYYQLDLAQIGYFVFGSSIRASSGISHNYLGSHPLYGEKESYILPRGTAPRSPLSTQVDVRVQYGRQLGNDMRLEAFLDVFNLFNRQVEINADDRYTFDAVNPIVGGTEEDLAHLKVVGSGQLAAKNPNFGNPNQLQNPLSMRFGLRFTF